MLTRSIARQIALATLAVQLLCAGAAAAEIFYDNRAAFDAALGWPQTIIDFEGIAPPGGQTSFGPNGALTLGGVTFKSVNDAELFVNSATFLPFDLANGDYLYTNGRVQFVDPGSYFSVGFDYGYIRNGVFSGPFFTGFISDHPLAFFGFGGGSNESVLIDRYTFGVVPEPSMLCLIGSLIPLAGAVGVCRRIRKRER